MTVVRSQVPPDLEGDPAAQELRRNHTVKSVDVYVCPTPDCRDYFGSSSMPDLEGEFTGPKTEDATTLERTSGSRFKHNRAECPSCRIRGIRVQRVRMTVQMLVPLKGPATPPLPPPTGRLHEVSASE